MAASSAAPSYGVRGLSVDDLLNFDMYDPYAAAGATDATGAAAGAAAEADDHDDGGDDDDDDADGGAEPDALPRQRRRTARRYGAGRDEEGRGMQSGRGDDEDERDDARLLHEEDEEELEVDLEQDDGGALRRAAAAARSAHGRGRRQNEAAAPRRLRGYALADEEAAAAAAAIASAGATAGAYGAAEDTLLWRQLQEQQQQQQQQVKQPTVRRLQLYPPAMQHQPPPPPQQSAVYQQMYGAPPVPGVPGTYYVPRSHAYGEDDGAAFPGSPLTKMEDSDPPVWSSSSVLNTDDDSETDTAALPTSTSAPLFSSFRLTSAAKNTASRLMRSARLPWSPVPGAVPAPAGPFAASPPASDAGPARSTDGGSHDRAGAREKLQRQYDLEKKRRENLNDYITALHGLVPALHTVHRPSKSTILSKTIEYLRRLQHKAARLETSMTETQNELSRLRNYNQLLLQLLTEHGVLPPDASSELHPRAAAATGAATAAPAARATGYFVQDAGRVMLLVVALMFFGFAPWGLPAVPVPAAADAATAAAATAPGGRALLSAANAGLGPSGSWAALVFWLAVRWVVMTALLALSMYWDATYCNAAILDNLTKIREMNRLAEECMSNGNYKKAKLYTEEALSLLRRPVPTSALDLFFGNLYQGARQLAHRCIVGLVLERFMMFSLGQSAYCAELERAYLNLSQQNHCLPGYDKWNDLYVILCSVNFAEIVEGDRGQGLVQAYGALCYHVVVHTRVFEVFASIYFSRAFDVVKRMGLHRSQFGQFYIVVAYRNLTQGRFQEAFDNLQRGMEMHNMFGLVHHYRECVLMKGWIEHIQGRQAESSQTFATLYNSATNDLDHYSQRWAMLGMVANSQHAGDYSKAAEWLARIAVLDEDLSSVNHHQEIFALGFTALQHLREGLEDGALAVADRTLERMLQTTRNGMPHSVLPMLKVVEVHLALLERNLRLDGPAAAAAAERLQQSIHKDFGLLRHFTAFFPVMESACLLCEGRYHFLTNGNEDKAQEFFRRAVDSARSYNMRHQEACGLFEIGRLLPVEHPQRRTYLEAALKLFGDMDAVYEERLTLNEMQTKFTSRLILVRPKTLA